MDVVFEYDLKKWLITLKKPCNAAPHHVGLIVGRNEI
jgi:hypothetical protein